MELNPKVWIIIAIIFILLLFSGLPFFMIKQTYYPSPKINITPNATPIIIIKYVNVTQTPDNGIYYVSDTENGTRKLQRYFVFHRDEVMGKKDLDFHITVYGYKMLDSYHWYNVHDSNTYETLPSSPDNKFLFIYVQLYSDMVSGDDVRNYIPAEQHFQINYKNVMYSPTPFTKELMIHELEQTYNFNDDSIIEYYAQYVSHPLMGANMGKYISVPQFILFGGKSNAVDGYIVFEVLKEAQPSDLIVYGDFFGYGYSNWVLKT
jgi:hypothetical protein